MKSSIWIFNSLTLLILFGLIGYILFYREKLSRKQSIEPIIQDIELIKKEVPKANIKRIYENDLFDTDLPSEEIEKVVKKREIKEIPAPPQEKNFAIKPPQEIEFLKPLDITLKGIIFTSHDKGQAIIEDNQTKKESLYKVGDKIIDGHILRIFSNKIIVIRSNGQQEIIYASKQEAQKAIENMQNSNWLDVINEKTKNCYIIDPEKFVKRINNLATFIDMLDLTTLFKNGESLGLRVGKLEKNSIGYALGLQEGDIIISINNICPTNTKNRVDIYSELSKSKIDDIVKLNIARNKNKLDINYILKKLKPIESPRAKDKIELETNSIDDKIEALNYKDKLSPLKRDIKRKDRQMMLNKGSKNAILDNLVI